MSETKRKPLYQPWNEEAFRADLRVGAMSPTQRWMYRTLLQGAFFHSTRPNLPDDDAQLWLLAGCESLKQWERNRDVVRAMFIPIEVAGVRLLSQKRLLADWHRIEEKREALAEAGRKGGRANAKHEQSKCLPGASNREANAKQEKLKEVKGSEVKEVKASARRQSAEPPVPFPLPEPAIQLPLNDGSEHAVSQPAVDEWVRLYPAVDVLQQLREMRGWLLANPRKRKTGRGIEAFINTWLAKEQDRGPRTLAGNSADRSGPVSVPLAPRRSENFKGGEATPLLPPMPPLPCR